MKLNKSARRMLYGVAVTYKQDHPQSGTHTCLEEAFIKCAGMSNYDESLESILPEYRNNPTLPIEDYLKMTAVNPTP